MGGKQARERRKRARGESGGGKRKRDKGGAPRGVRGRFGVVYGGEREVFGREKDLWEAGSGSGNGAKARTQPVEYWAGLGGVAEQY